MDNVIPKTGKKRIVIVGCGFGGLKLARKLRFTDVQVVLIDKQNYHQFQPLFYQVATSGIEPSAISFPIRKILQTQQNAYFRVAEVKNIITERNQLETSIGVIDYDYLVLATGATNNFFGMANIEKYSFPMKTTSESIILRNKLLQNLEDAVGNADEEERKALLTVTVIGGGPTGVEISGALGEMKNYVIPKDYREINMNELKVILIEGSSRLLPNMSTKASIKAESYLEELNVSVMKNSRVTDYDGSNLTLANGQSMQTKTVVWAAGIAGNVIPGIKKEMTGRGNRIMVNEFSQVNGFQNIFAIGDLCLMHGDEKYANGHPQIAPVAIQQANNLARNIDACLGNKQMKGFKYNHQGSMATVGRNRAVVDFNIIKYYGFLAWATWLFVHLMSIVGIKNRLFIFINWMWSYITYDQSLRLIIRTCTCKPDQKNP